eukprot:scaffold10227_cov132-Skeletonema_menzelii.AAC.1
MQPQFAYPLLVNNVVTANRPHPFGGMANYIFTGSFQLPGSGLFTNSAINSSGISRSIIEQQGAVNMMSTASMIPKKVTNSLRRAKEQGGQTMPQLQTLTQPHAQNLPDHYRQQSQSSQHQQLNQPPNTASSSRYDNILEESTDDVIPLRNWIEKESSGDCKPDNVQKQRGMMLRRTAIAYGVIELIKGARTSSHSSTCDELQKASRIDNFLVRLSKGEKESRNDDNDDQHFVGKIKGVQMINPPSNLLFLTPFVSADEMCSGKDDDGLEHFIEVEIFPRPLANQAINTLEQLVKEKALIHSVGSLIHELYTEGNPILLLYEFQKGSGANPTDDSDSAEPPSKRIKEHPQQMAGASFHSLFPLSLRGNTESASANATEQKASHLPLLELGFSSSLSTLVSELLGCKCTLDAASKDLRLLLLDPDSFLVDRYFKPAPDGKVLPNTKLFHDTKRAKPVASKHQGSEIQSNSVSYILRLFMRAVSSQERPVVLFIDDLHWCDATSLEIVYDIVSDKKGSSCVYFLGCFRDNEIGSEHPIFQLIQNMNRNNVPVQLLGLSGVNRNELNCMTSDALCILPRHCKDLSDIVHSKTKGDPYFALEMLSALVDRGLLQFNFPKRRWTWNQADIMYLDDTSNVLHLLKGKMMSMPTQMQTALKICSCFGSGIDTRLVRCLSDSVEYSGLREELDRAVTVGFVEKAGECYKFVHDRVKEAAYDLIDEKDKERYHHQVGMVLLTSSSVDDSLVSIMIDQINHGVGELIQSEKDRVAIAELNYKAGVTAMTHSGFVKAFSYFETAKSLLPVNHWTSQYYFSIRLFLSFSNAAFACGYGDLADEALDAILREATCLEDKLDAYYFTNNLLFHRGQTKAAITKCTEVLSGLGETIPTKVDANELNDMLRKFYQQRVWFGFFGDSPAMQSFLSCRSVEIAIRVGFCKYTAVSINSVAALLCGMSKDISTGYRLGRISLSLLTRFNATNLIPIVYLGFYGLVAFNSEPVKKLMSRLPADLIDVVKLHQEEDMFGTKAKNICDIATTVLEQDIYNARNDANIFVKTATREFRRPSLSDARRDFIDVFGQDCYNRVIERE